MDKAYTSYSGLGKIDGWLKDKPEMKIDEIFLLFGRELHSLWLENKSSNVKLSQEDKTKIDKMVQALNKNKDAMSLYNGAKKEYQFPEHQKIGNVQMKVIIDIYKPKKYSADLKSTSCVTEESCVKKMVEFGYFKQGLCYKLATGVDNFYFIFVSKKEPHEVFIINVDDYPAEEKAAWNELKFLLYLFENHQSHILI